MKRTLLTFITALMAFPLFAQYTGPGFYRIQNQGAAGRYISIQNDKVSEDSKKIKLSNGTAANAPVEALQLVKSKDSDPGSILYISGSESGFTIEAQGMNTDKLLNDFGYGNIKLQMSSQGELKTEYSGFQIDLIDYCYDYPKSRPGFCGIATLQFLKQLETTDRVYALWTFKKIDNENEFFGVYPSENIKIGNKYYTTLFTSFAYQLPEGMKAFYIDQHNYNVQAIGEPIAELKEITGGKIPAATPVIIECSSENAADNKVTLLNENLSSISNNELKGRVFCFVPTANEDQSMKNALEFNKSTMRVLGLKNIKRDDRGNIVDGQLALVNEASDNYNNTLSLTNGYIPANKAYLPISSSYANATANGIKLLLPEEYAIATSINSVMNDNETTKDGVFTLTGVKVKDTNSTDNLPRGIYIIGGKKHIVR